MESRGGFAEKRNEWDNKFMSKLTIAVIGFLALGLASSGPVFGQQAPAAGSPQTPAAPAKPATGAKSATGGQTSATPKTGQAAGAKRPATPAVALKTQKEKASYAIGQNIGKGLQKDGVDVDAASMARGIRDALAGGKSLLTPEEAQAALTALATEVRAKQQIKMVGAG